MENWKQLIPATHKKRKVEQKQMGKLKTKSKKIYQYCHINAILLWHSSSNITIITLDVIYLNTVIKAGDWKFNKDNQLQAVEKMMENEKNNEKKIIATT